MRLLNVNTLKMSSFTQDLEDPDKDNILYATLSHTWGDEEVTFQDLQRSDKPSKKGYEKILGCCRQAKKDGIEWVWIDTCCIDKTNSAELSEAINSMYALYQHSAVCYVLLEDVPPRTPKFPTSAFWNARWFTRGWCLQELIAPDKVEFYAKDWSDIGTKWSLHEDIKDITGIPRDALLDRCLENYSVAQKMTWASRRTTTRVEDEAYCLLGIFGINMPLIYGEGRKSFQRLQIEIMKQEEDYSFLLWDSGGLPPPNPLGVDHAETFAVLASKPSVFKNWMWLTGLLAETVGRFSFQDIEPFHHSRKSIPEDVFQKLALRKPPQLMSRGLLVHMFVQKDRNFLGTSGYVLLWTEYTYHGQLVCIAIIRKPGGAFATYDRALAHSIFLIDSSALGTFELSELHLTTDIGKLYRPRSVTKTKKVQSLPDLEIFLSSKWNTTVRFIQSIPPIGFLTPEDSLTYSPPPLGPRLYCCFIPQEVLRRPQGSNYFLIKLQFRHTKSDVRVAIGLMVTLWLDPVFPRCCVSASDNPGELVEEEGNAHLQSCQNDYDESSDRADCKIPGSSHMVSIMVKGCREPGTFPGVDRKPACFTLYVTVLPSGFYIS